MIACIDVYFDRGSMFFCNISTLILMTTWSHLPDDSNINSSPIYRLATGFYLETTKPRPHPTPYFSRIPFIDYHATYTCVSQLFSSFQSFQTIQYFALLKHSTYSKHASCFLLENNNSLSWGVQVVELFIKHFCPFCFCVCLRFKYFHQHYIF